MKADERGGSVVLGVMPDQLPLFVKHDPTSSLSYVANQFRGYASRVSRSEWERA